MLVEDDPEAGLLRVPDHIVQLVEPLGLELVAGVHVPEGLQIDAYEIERCFADLAEVPPLEAPPVRVGPIGIVTEDIHSAQERMVGLLEYGNRRRGGEWLEPKQQTCRCKQSERQKVFHAHHYRPRLVRRADLAEPFDEGRQFDGRLSRAKWTFVLLWRSRDDAPNITVYLPGMTCHACASLIERRKQARVHVDLDGL